MRFVLVCENQQSIHTLEIFGTDCTPGPDYVLRKNFIIILALLLCVTVARADELIAIKESDATRYVGKEVEARGRVVSVTTSPLGTAFINFGGEYPNQTFAGFIAAGSRMATDERLTLIQGKIISITGTIRLRDGKPEIEIVSADQIKVLDSQTER